MCDKPLPWYFIFTLSIDDCSIQVLPIVLTFTLISGFASDLYTVIHVMMCRVDEKEGIPSNTHRHHLRSCRSGRDLHPFLLLESIPSQHITGKVMEECFGFLLCVMVSPLFFSPCSRFCGNSYLHLLLVDYPRFQNH